MIRLVNISKKFGEREIFKNFNLEIEQGSSIAILGKSGVGKTTLLNILGMIESIDSGELYINDIKIKKINSKIVQKIRKEQIGYLFQNFGLIENATIYENLKIVFEFSSKKKKELEEIMHKVLKQVELDELPLDTPIYSLSGGEQQRLAIARVLMKNPTIIFADEPTGSLDKETATNIMEILIKLNKQNNCTLVMVTHDPEMAQFCEKTIHIKGE